MFDIYGTLSLLHVLLNPSLEKQIVSPTSHLQPFQIPKDNCNRAYTKWHEKETQQVLYVGKKWEKRVHAGNTTYTADSHPNSTPPRQGNNIECKWLQKHRRHTETNKHLLREKWEYRPGTVSDKCLWKTIFKCMYAYGSRGFERQLKSDCDFFLHFI